MSLKAIHLVFIAASTLLSIGFGVWCLKNYFQGLGSTSDLLLGLGSIAVAAGLICYGRYFLKKLKNIGYL
ncbi:MAG: hypothetical protein HY735_12445 [Verrucomicrobia bacterium]|nr:hypothetical protein [Verrucomicrobiota bacterium]